MKQVFSVAKFTLKENISNRIFNGFIFFGLLILFMTVILRELTLYEEVKVIKDTGLFLIEFFVLMIAVFVSSTQFIKEQKDKSIYLVLTKPVSRGMYITGRIIGMMFTIGINIVVMGIALAAVLFFLKDKPDLWIITALFCIFLKLSIVAAIGILFSVLSDSFVTANIFTISIYAAAHGVEEIRMMANKIANPVYKVILEGIYYALPNFRVLNYRDYIQKTDINNMSIVLYSIGYICVVAVIANIIFYRKKI